MKVDYLIIRQEDSPMHYKRGWPGQKNMPVVTVAFNIHVPVSCAYNI